MARHRAYAGGSAVAPPRLTFRATPGRRAGRAVPRDIRATRNPEPVVSRDRRDGRRSGRHRDVAPGAREGHAARRMDGGRGATAMTCDEAEILLHALLDGELDAGHAREVENH